MDLVHPVSNKANIGMLLTLTVRVQAGRFSLARMSNVQFIPPSFTLQSLFTCPFSHT